MIRVRETDFSLQHTNHTKCKSIGLQGTTRDSTTEYVFSFVWELSISPLPKICPLELCLGELASPLLAKFRVA